MNARTKLTPEKREAFLENIATSCNVTEAARSIGMSRVRLYEVRAVDDEFAKQWDAALQEGIDKLEREAQRRAFEGVEEPVFYQGDRCGTVRKYSDLLTIFLLKAHRPERFRETSKVELSGSLNLNDMSDDDLRAELASLAVAGVVPIAPAPSTDDDDDDCSDLY